MRVAQVTVRAMVDAEKSDAYELGVKLRSERADLNAAVYPMNVQDEIFFDPFAINPFTGFAGRNLNIQRVRHRDGPPDLFW